MNKILVIEDEDDIRSNLCEMLSAENFEAIEAENGYIGVQRALSTLPDLILCDIMMPQLDGYGVLDQLRQHPSTEATPFIFLTAKAAKTDLRQGMDLGADDYLTKPFTRDELLTAIAARLEKQGVVERQSQKKLDQLRGQISHSLPHELYTPLNGIIGLSSYMFEEYDSIEREEALEMLGEIRTSGRRLYRLTQNFLLYAELELMATAPERMKALRSQEVKTCSATILSEVASQKAQQIGRVDDLQLNLQRTVVYMLEAYYRKLIEELVDNAFKFSTPGTLVCVSDRTQGNRVFVSVRDQGRGMTPEQIANLGAYMQFERKLYEQQGSGLGLAIAQRLVQLHGGELTIDSTPAEQTTVRVELPGELSS